jgi:ribosome recycling factor
MINDIRKNADERMRKSIEALKDEFKRLRTGRAQTGLIEHVMVEYYGSRVPIQQTSTVSVEDSRTLTVVPWDRQMVAAVEKAIINSDLGLTPATAGNVIRVPLPPMTEERRKDLVRVVRHETEGARVAIRNIRRDAMNDLKELLKEKLITEDEDRRAHDEIQKLTDQHVAEADRMLVDKETEIMDF